ncbi:MAG: flavin reductase family protein [Rhizobiaceae bacterium]|nr:flavin reductase family protein [Rhizobiaceae bacterium]
MFYEPKNGHGLPFSPSKAIVSPRPIGWISTLSVDGVPNLAPYSFFNMFSDKPFSVMFASDRPKDSAKNAVDTGEFVANLASHDLAEAVNASSIDAPADVDEFVHAGIDMAPCVLVKAPRVAAAHAALECKVSMAFHPKDADGNDMATFIVMGEVVGVHIDDRYLRDGQFDASLAGNLARLGYHDYLSVAELFQMRRPKWGE